MVYLWIVAALAQEKLSPIALDVLCLQVEAAQERGSTDNIAVVVSQLAALHKSAITDPRPARLKFTTISAAEPQPV